MSNMEVRGGLLELQQGSDEEFSDDEMAPLNSNAIQDEDKMWNVFRNVPQEAGSLSEDSENFMASTIKFLKVVTYFLVFVVVLGGAGISKVLVLMMTSQLVVGRNVSICYKQDVNNLPQGRDYVAHIPLSENIAWAWVLFFTFIIPEIMTFGRSLRMIIFKSPKRGRVGDVLVVLLFEILHALGTGGLIFFVLPGMDVVKGAMLTNCVCFIPCLFGMLSRVINEDEDKDDAESKKMKNSRMLKIWVDMLALAAQLTGFIVWPLIIWYEDRGNPTAWILPIAIFLISFGWWENYVDRNSAFRLIKNLGEVKDRLYKSRYFIYLIVPFFKCIIFFGCMMLSQWKGPKTEINDFEQIFNFTRAFGEQRDKIIISEVRQDLDGNSGEPLITLPVPSVFNSPLYVLAIHACCTWATYVTGKFACKICIQGFSFAFPVSISVPLVISFLVGSCGTKFSSVCSFEFMPRYLFWSCDEGNGNIINDFVVNDWSWLWILWVVSQTWITIHVWKPKAKRLASTEQLFVRPMYNAMLIDQSLSLNRRRDDQDAEIKIDDIQARVSPEDKTHQEYYETNDNESESSEGAAKLDKVKSSDQVIRIYGCATMWHENKEEMLEMLKSLFRMDEDQCARRVAQKYLQVIDPDYYEFETHMFFDDAFEIADENEDENVVNDFVELLVNTIDEAASYVHGTNLRIRPAKKYPTPYGGRLVWTLPGKTKIVCHLKDKSRIRHKKRWSQCMYMYYLLGFKLMDQPIDSTRKEIIASNTFILALDGDIDFTPYAVRLLIDLMKKNHNLGAACGRIHPVGPGLMVWYQMFEYAIGHWLQKATEHMIGCVLCSPGCFSLFRGKALMDDNVMAKYTTLSSEAMHYVQYDQGEDRWLCTLILQRGYRVEYSAAADSYTNAPTGFNEFFNQRRRWVPSTMANIMDVLKEWRRTIQVNDNISFPYICYQLGLMVGTILGPGTIFLMLVGSFNAAFGWDNLSSFGYNLIPIVGFMFCCYFMKSKNQLTVAYLLTALYALVMCIVIVGMMLNFAQEGWNTPTAIFFVATAASFIITGLLHPQEFWCLPCGLIYYLLVPSMYLLLILYSVFNLNDVSWGTREVPKKAKKKTREEVEAEKKAMEEAKKQKQREGILGFLRSTQDKNDEGSFEFSCAGLFKFMCCVQSRPDVQSAQLARIAESLDGLKRRFEGIETKIGIEPRRRSTISSRRNTVSSRSMSMKGSTLSEPVDEEILSDEDDESQVSEPKEERDHLVNPYWMEDKRLKRGEVDYIPSNEVTFFNELIETYLKPLEDNKEKQKKVANELKELRDNAVFSFSMMNAIFVIFTFMLQLNKDTIHMDWPLGVQANVTYVLESAAVLVEKKFVQLEPIGFIFVIFFATLLFIQFTGMLFHRFGTFSHILSHTELDLCNKKADELTEDAWLDANAVKIAKQMQKLKGVDGDDNANSSAPINRRMTVHNLERHHQQKTVTGSLDVAFKRRFFSISAEAATNENIGNGRPSIAGVPVTGAMRRLSMRRGTIQALANRRQSVVEERRASRVAGRSSVSFAADVV